MSVRENLEMGCYLRRDAAGIEADMRRLYERFPILHERRNQAAGTLSGGEQQMLAISRALMSRPKLVLFDEPSLGLAPNIVERTFDIIRQIRGEGVTVVMVEQNALAALELSDRSYVLEQGRVSLTGTGQALLDNPHVGGVSRAVAGVDTRASGSGDGGRRRGPPAPDRRTPTIRAAATLSLDLLDGNIPDLPA